jgi:Calcium binding
MPNVEDPIRQKRIDYEVIVDCYDDDEVAMGWYYYLSENLVFPIPATVQLKQRGGKMEEVNVEIVEVDPKSEEGSPIRLGITEKGQKRVQYISPEVITNVKTSPTNTLIINDWLYWNNTPLLPEGDEVV